LNWRREIPSDNATFGCPRGIQALR